MFLEGTFREYNPHCVCVSERATPCGKPGKVPVNLCRYLEAPKLVPEVNLSFHWVFKVRALLCTNLANLGGNLANFGDFWWKFGEIQQDLANFGRIALWQVNLGYSG